MQTKLLAGVTYCSRVTEASQGPVWVLLWATLMCMALTEGADSGWQTEDCRIKMECGSFAIIRPCKAVYLSSWATGGGWNVACCGWNRWVGLEVRNVGRTQVKFWALGALRGCGSEPSALWPL